ncbi:hypothetical protein Hanom_Chr07g00593311 [Helianthus anomalus]
MLACRYPATNGIGVGSFLYLYRIPPSSSFCHRSGADTTVELCVFTLELSFQFPFLDQVPLQDYLEAFLIGLCVFVILSLT